MPAARWFVSCRQPLELRDGCLDVIDIDREMLKARSRTTAPARALRALHLEPAQAGAISQRGPCERQLPWCREQVEHLLGLGA